MNDLLFFNGDILTLEAPLYTEAIWVKDGIIQKLGTKEALLKEIRETTKQIDLQGKTLMPAFIDPHSHFSGYATNLLQVNVENATSFEEIADMIKTFIKEKSIPEGKWVLATGYDQNNLVEKAHPTKELLDLAAPLNPLALRQQSGHMGVFNTLGLEALNITPDTPNPTGGVIDKKDGELTGYLEENAFIDSIQKVPMPSMEELTKAFLDAQKAYASYGITTMQEGMIVDALVDLLKMLQHTKLLKLDLIGFIDLSHRDSLRAAFKDCIKTYHNHIKIGGYKIFLDGSPQSRTAWMLTPYKDSTEKGYGTHTDEEVEKLAEIAIADQMQLIAHCNGDAASKQYITAFDKATKALKPDYSIRPVIIHAQLLPEDQLDEVKQLNMIPSFFLAHVYHWGDTHIKNFGFKRASKISLAASALKKDILFTLHQDAPVIEPNMLETIWCAVNRVTKSGVVLGEEERISPLEAIKAVTINAAYQYFEENEKGSLKEGKLADLIILDQNPLKIDPMAIKNITVLETFKAGERIFAYSNSKN